MQDERRGGCEEPEAGKEQTPVPARQHAVEDQRKPRVEDERFDGQAGDEHGGNLLRPRAVASDA